MPKLSFKDKETLYEPIIVEGLFDNEPDRVITINKFTDSMAQSIQDFGKDFEGEKEINLTPKHVNEMLSFLFNEPAETFEPLDFRKKQEVIVFVMDKITPSNEKEKTEEDKQEGNVSKL